MTSPRRTRQARLSWAGILLGPLAWAAATQLNYALVPWGCARGIQLVPWIALLGTAIALVGAALSWPGWRGPARAEEPRVTRFVAALGVGLALLFAFVILLQGVAAFVLSGCER